MDNFERVLREALENGASLDGLAKRIEATMNTLQKEQEQKNDRQAKLDKYEEAFKHYYNAESITDDVAISFLTLYYAKLHPDWDGDTIQMFYDNMKSNAKLNADLLSSKTTGEFTNRALKELDDVFKDVFGKSKDKRSWEDIDSAKIRRFLRGLD